MTEIVVKIGTWFLDAYSFFHSSPIHTDTFSLKHLIASRNFNSNEVFLLISNENVIQSPLYV